MTTYKTLIRKSDGQYVRFRDDDIINGIELLTNFQCNNIFEYVNESLYDLIEVAVIPVADIPTENDIRAVSQNITDQAGNELIVLELTDVIELINRLK